MGSVSAFINSVEEKSGYHSLYASNCVGVSLLCSKVLKRRLLENLDPEA